MEQEHMEDDSVKLLRECNAGIKMGTSSIEDVLEHVQSGGLSGVLKDSHDIHCKLGNKSLYRYLNQYPAADKEIVHLTKDIISTEEKLLKALRPYL